MEMYLGVKLIQAREMSRGRYNSYRGWEVPADEDPNDEGYLVEYLDSLNANHAEHTGYISWSPKDVFERAYRPTIGMTFGLAVEALKQGQKVARAGWNGKGMWLQYVEGGDWDVFTINAGYVFRSFIAMKTVDDQIVPWVASQSDVLAEDWSIV